MEDTLKIGELVYVKSEESDDVVLGTLIQPIPFREKDKLSFIWHTLVGLDLHYVSETNISRIPESDGKKSKKN